MGLPSGFEARSEADWLALAKSDDAKERKIISNVLRALGQEPTAYMSWSAEERVKVIMGAQGEGGGKEEGKGKTKGSAKSAGSSDGGGASGGAAVAELKAELETLQSKMSDIQDLLTILVLSVPAAKANAEEFDIELKLGNG